MGGSGLVAIALLVLAYAAVSRRLSGSVITAAMVFVAGGMLASDEVLGWLDPTIESETVRWVAEATLTVVLFSDASRIDLGALRREYVVPLRLLAIGLPLTIVAGALAGVAVLGELALIEAVLLAIVLAPTDAALGQAVVTDPRVPSRVRQGLNVESGLNDGICVPLLLIAIAIAEAKEGAIGDGAAVHLVLEEIGYGCLGGVIAGLAAAAVVRVGVPRRLVDSIWLQVVPVAGAALAYGLAVWMGGSGFIAAFVGGARLRRVASRGRGRGDALPRGDGRPARCGHVRPLRRRHARADARRPLRRGRPVCASQPDGRSHGSRGPGDARIRRQADRRSPSSAGSGRGDWRRSCLR